MERRTIELRIAGQKYRVVSSADEEELHRLAEVVSEKLRELSVSAKATPAQGLVLAALALAHEAEAERERRTELAGRTRELLHRILARVDHALAEPEGGEAASGG